MLIAFTPDSVINWIFEDTKMIARKHILVVAAFCMTTSLSLRAQEQQGQGQPQGGAQGASIMPASSADTQGIRRYVLGPGDTLDVRVFGQPDLNWTGEV